MSGEVLCIFTVAGKPRVKGNVIKGRFGGYHDATKGLTPWMEAVRKAARDAWAHGEPSSAAIRVDVHFMVPARSTDVLRAGLREGIEPVTRGAGDLDKLSRAVLDALTGIAYVDDSQVVDLRARKRYAIDAGAMVTVMEAAA